RCSVPGGAPFSQLLEQVRKTMLDAYDHQQYTFGTLLRKLPLPRDPSRLPLVSVVFNLDRGMTNEAIGFEDLIADLSSNPRRYENFELFVNAVEANGRITLECQYNTDLFDATTIRRWLAAYERLLQGIAEDQSTEIARLPLLSSEENAQLDAW